MSALNADGLQHLADRLLRLRAMTGMAEGIFRQSLAVYARRHRRASNGLPPDTAEGLTLPSGVRFKTVRAIAGPTVHRAVLRDRPVAQPVRRATDQLAPRTAVANAAYGPATRKASLMVAPAVGLANRIATRSGLAASKVVSYPFLPPSASVRDPILTRSSSAVHRAYPAADWSGRRNSGGGCTPYAALEARSGLEIRRVPFAPRAPVEHAADTRRMPGAAAELPGDSRGKERLSAHEMPPLPAADRGDPELGRWMMDYLERQLSRPRLGMTGVDPRISPL